MSYEHRFFKTHIEQKYPEIIEELKGKQGTLKGDLNQKGKN